MSPDEIKELRQQLECTARELAETLGIEQKLVLAWERAEAFATKQHIEKMQALRKQGPQAVVRGPRRTATVADPEPDDPRLGRVVRALVEHPDLLKQVAKLVDRYEKSSED